MSIDPSTFIRSNVSDTCAIWNLFSSDIFYAKARSEGCNFCCTHFVYYECAIKRRTLPTRGELLLLERFRTAHASGEFQSYPLSIADLQDVDVLRARNNLGRGELTTIVFARRTSQAVFTDDQRARRLAGSLLGAAYAQTSPHLMAWLAYNGRVSAIEKNGILSQQNAIRPEIVPYIEQGYKMGLQYRTMAQTCEQ